MMNGRIPIETRYRIKILESGHKVESAGVDCVSTRRLPAIITQGSSHHLGQLDIQMYVPHPGLTGTPSLCQLVQLQPNWNAA